MAKLNQHPDMDRKREVDMIDAAEQQLKSTLASLYERLMTHPLYAQLLDEETIRVFTEAHVFAVW